MNYSKIEKGKVLFRLEENEDWKDISNIEGLDLIELIGKSVSEEDFEMQEYDESLIQNEAHKIIYYSIYQKIKDIQNDRDSIIDANNQRYKDIIEKYSNS